MLHMASVGIIGGADGPTAVFITTGDWTSWIIPILAVLACVGVWYFIRKKR